MYIQFPKNFPRIKSSISVFVLVTCIVCVRAKLFGTSYPTLCNLLDHSPPGSSVHDIFQVRILEWVTMLSSRKSYQPRDGTHISYVSCTGSATREPSSAQSHVLSCFVFLFSILPTFKWLTIWATWLSFFSLEDNITQR